MSAGREPRPTVSFAALATSEAFVGALVRDVNILVHSFALTWSWLDGQTAQPPAPPVPLRWEYGALLVFERVWTRNQWQQLPSLFGSDPSTRRAFYESTARAFLDTIAQAESDVSLLHAVGALMGLYLLWSGQGTPMVWPSIGVDKVFALPERARRVLDTGVAPGHTPPSADVWYTVQVLLGRASRTQGPVLVLHVPKAPTRLEAQTTLMPRGERATRPSTHGEVGRRNELVLRSETSHAPSQEQVHASIVDMLGIPHPQAQPVGSSRATAQSLDALVQSQGAYVGARNALRDVTSGVPGLYDEQDAMAFPTFM